MCDLPAGSAIDTNCGQRLSFLVVMRCNVRNKSLSFINGRNDQMNALSMKGEWNEIAGKLKQQFANLTDDDLLFKEGKEEELLGRLQQKLGKTKEELRKLIAKI